MPWVFSVNVIEKIKSDHQMAIRETQQQSVRPQPFALYAVKWFSSGEKCCND